MACYWGNYCAYETTYVPTFTYYIQPAVHYQYVSVAAPPCFQHPVYVSSCACAPAVAVPTPAVRTSTYVQTPVPAAAPAPRVVLPSANYSCYAEPVIPCGQERHIHYQEPTIVRNVELNFYDTQTVVRENNNHYTHNRTVVTNVNRNHWHTQRVITHENNYNTYLTNNIIRVNDIHHQRVENVEGEKRVFNDYKQTKTVEPAKCVVAVDAAIACNESSN